MCRAHHHLWACSPQPPSTTVRSPTPRALSLQSPTAEKAEPVSWWFIGCLTDYYRLLTHTFLAVVKLVKIRFSIQKVGFLTNQRTLACLFGTLLSLKVGRRLFLSFFPKTMKGRLLQRFLLKKDWMVRVSFHPLFLISVFHHCDFVVVEWVERGQVRFKPNSFVWSVNWALRKRLRTLNRDLFNVRISK